MDQPIYRLVDGVNGGVSLKEQEGRWNPVTFYRDRNETDLAAPSPACVGAFTSDEAVHHVEAGCISRKEDYEQNGRMKPCGMSVVVGNGTGHHVNVCTSVQSLNRSHIYSVPLHLERETDPDLYSILTLLMSGWLIQRVKVTGNKKEFTCSAWICFSCQNHIPAQFEIVPDIVKENDGHHVIRPIDFEPCYFFGPHTRFLLPILDFVAVCPALVQLEWKPHCMKLMAQAEPSPFESRFDGDMWEIAKLFYENPAKEDFVFNLVGGIMDDWEEKQYQFSRDTLSKVDSIRDILESFSNDNDTICRFLRRYDELRLSRPSIVLYGENITQLESPEDSSCFLVSRDQFLHLSTKWLTDFTSKLSHEQFSGIAELNDMVLTHPDLTISCSNGSLTAMLNGIDSDKADRLVELLTNEFIGDYFLTLLGKRPLMTLAVGLTESLSIECSQHYIMSNIYIFSLTEPNSPEYHGRLCRALDKSINIMKRSRNLYGRTLVLCCQTGHHIVKFERIVPVEHENESLASAKNERIREAVERSFQPVVAAKILFFSFNDLLSQAAVGHLRHNLERLGVSYVQEAQIKVDFMDLESP